MSRTTKRSKDCSWPPSDKAKFRKTERPYKKERAGRERALQRDAMSHMDFDDLNHEQARWDNRLTHWKGDWYG